ANANGGVTYPNFAALMAGGTWEAHSVLVSAGVLSGGLVGPSDWQPLLMPATPELAGGSTAIARGVVLPNLNDGSKGAAPDLGAIGAGCAAPIYGVRPMGTDETNEPLSCGSGSGAGAGGAGGGSSGAGGGSSGGGKGGCGCRAAPSEGE